MVTVWRKHLIPFRTQQLSSKTLMVLRGQLRGRVSRRQVYKAPNANSIRGFSILALSQAKPGCKKAIRLFALWLFLVVKMLRVFWFLLFGEGLKAILFYSMLPLSSAFGSHFPKFRGGRLYYILSILISYFNLQSSIFNLLSSILYLITITTNYNEN